VEWNWSDSFNCWRFSSKTASEFRSGTPLYDFLVDFTIIGTQKVTKSSPLAAENWITSGFVCQQNSSFFCCGSTVRIVFDWGKSRDLFERANIVYCIGVLSNTVWNLLPVPQAVGSLLCVTRVQLSSTKFCWSRYGQSFIGVNILIVGVSRL
jgi:hypothetical protein